MENWEKFTVMTDLGVMLPHRRGYERPVTFSVPSEWLREWMIYEELDDVLGSLERLMCAAMSEGVIRWEEVD